ncbi:MAG TPA: type II toxin-antitoxin system VapC family toxin [Fimbriiglobus sp.]|nr:type II toxin-antitoxin system VapC family toxin [Fimbriiglobus sp.]
MTAFDTDVVSDLFNSVPGVVARMAALPAADLYVPIVVAEEVFRGRLDAIRKAQAGATRFSLEKAYEEFAKSLTDLRQFQTLPYTAAADALFKAWRTAKVRIGTQDLRIAAICLVHGAKLVTRNARDYAQVPGLNLEVWP